jgi:integrase
MNHTLLFCVIPAIITRIKSEAPKSEFLRVTPLGVPSEKILTSSNTKSISTVLAPSPALALNAFGSATSATEGSDAWCIAAWLQTCAPNSENTRRSYRREACRWLAFLTWVDLGDQAIGVADGVGRSNLIQGARYEHAGAYLDWVRGESDRSDLPEWIASACGVAAARPKSTAIVLRHAVLVLNGMYEELGALWVGTPPGPVVPINPFRPYRKQFNPLRKSRGRQNPDAHGVAKALTDRAWDLLWKVACQELEPQSENSATQTLAGQPRKRAQAARPKLQARRRLALAMLRATWDRRSSVAALTWADLTRSRDGVWMVWQQRKGSEPAWYPVPEGLIAEIALFRQAVGLQAMPQPEEKARSLYWTGGAVGANGPISDESLYRDLKVLFSRAAIVATEQGDVESAAQLTRAGVGPHTIRHTMATQFMAAGGQARVAQEILGHASIATTTNFYDSRQVDEQLDAMQGQWERRNAARYTNH